MRKRIYKLTIGVSLAVMLAALSACVHTELIWREFENRTLYIDVSVEPDAEIDASYYLRVDPDDPVGTFVSIGSSVAKAAQVEEAHRRMDRAMQRIDLGEIVRNEVSAHFRDAQRMRIEEQARSADYTLEVDVWRYGIRANDELGGTFFEVHCHSRLYDGHTGTMIWDDFEMVERRIGPELFGIPSADNLLSAAMLAGVGEEEIASGLSRATREIAWEIGEQFSRDLRFARRSR